MSGLSQSKARFIAQFLYGPTAVVVRAKHPTDRHQRFRVAFVGKSHEGLPALFMAGMGESWAAAFEAAKENPVATARASEVNAGRVKMRAAMEAAEKEKNGESDGAVSVEGEKDGDLLALDSAAQ